MALSTAVQQAITRLQEFYNGNAYDADTNAGGLAEGGHRVNEIPLAQDMADVAEAIADEAGGAAQAKTDAETAETNAQGHETAAQNWATYAEDATVPGGGGEYSAKHYAAKAEDAKIAAEAAATSLQFPVYSTGGTASAYTITDADLTIADGAAIRLNFHAANNASPTLEETNDGNAYEIVAPGNRALDAAEITLGFTSILYFDAAINKWIALGLPLYRLVQDLDANGNKITKLREYRSRIFHGGTVFAVTGKHVVTFREAVRLHAIDASLVAGSCTAALKKNGSAIGGLSAVSVTTTQTETAVNDSSNAYIDFSAGDKLSIDISSVSSATFLEIWLDLEARA